MYEFIKQVFEAVEGADLLNLCSKFAFFSFVSSFLLSSLIPFYILHHHAKIVTYLYFFKDWVTF